MLRGENTYILLKGTNKVETLWLVLFGYVKKATLLVMAEGVVVAEVMRCSRFMGFLNRYIAKKVKEQKAVIGRRKGLWYEINSETVDLTNRFYEQKIGEGNRVVDFYDRAFCTEKFEAYLKQEISSSIFSVLNDLHSARLLYPDNMNILMVRNPINEFVASYMEDKYQIAYAIKRVPSIVNAGLLFLYYGELLFNIARRGFVFNKKREFYRLSKESTWGFFRQTTRDDVLIDGERFTRDDLLLIESRSKEPYRRMAFKQATERGFHTASFSSCKINLRKNIAGLLFFYCFVPVRWYFELFFRKQFYLFYYLFTFHRRCFPCEILMNLYNIKCHASVIDHADVETTMVFNKYGTKNIIFHWSDLTPFKKFNWYFLAHNIYFLWGAKHLDFKNDFIDDKILIGCIFKKEYSQAKDQKEGLMKRIKVFCRAKKTVAFFDTGFNEFIHFTPAFFLEFWAMVEEFCRRNADINVMIKPRNIHGHLLTMLGSRKNDYEMIWKKLLCCENFIYLNPMEWTVQDAIALSDVSVNMGLNTPATIALICGKEGLYYENTGNRDHPFADKYMHQIVFDDQERLFEQVHNILEGRFSCHNVIREYELREYDAFSDNDALERLRKYLFELTSGKIPSPVCGVAEDDSKIPKHKIRSAQLDQLNV